MIMIKMFDAQTLYLDPDASFDFLISFPFAELKDYKFVPHIWQYGFTWK